MEIELRVPAPVRRAHVRLARRLEELPASVSVVAAPAPEDPGFRLMRLERVLTRHLADAHLPAAPSAPATTPGEATSTVTVDLTGHPGDGWSVWFGDRPGESALLAALQRGRLPLVSVRDGAGRTIVSGRPGSELPGVVTTAYADVLAGLATLLLAALRGAPLSTPVPDSASESESATGSPVRGGRPLPVVAARKVVGSVARHGYRALYRAPHWKVGWRLLTPGEPDVVDLLDHPPGGWNVLPDDGRHFYADPFPVVHAGQTWLFVEDFDHRVGRGVISAVAFDDSGPVGTPAPVLEHDVHLSYPFVLEHAGESWMIPETSGARTVELYRARAFPHRWVREAVLLDGLEASDVTVLEHGGRWWMTATVRQGGSFSDTLCAWSAEELTGPWRPHPLNPLLVDIASARPAGRIVSRDGRLLRPVQDNRNGYGASLLVTEVTRLDDEGFAQQVLAEIGPTPASWPGRRLHTLNRAGRLEVIDGSALSPRFGRPRGTPS